MGLVVTYHTVLKRIGAHAPTLAIPTTQQEGLNILFTSRAVLYLFVFEITPIMQSKGDEL